MASGTRNHSVGGSRKAAGSGCVRSGKCAPRVIEIDLAPVERRQLVLGDVAGHH
jgi:hypothetical protein